MSQYDELYKEKIEKFKQQKEQKINALRQQIYQNQQSPIINEKSQLLASQKLEKTNNPPIFERIQKVDLKTEQAPEQYSFKPEITQLGKEFQRDKPVIESLYIWQDIANKKKETKKNQQSIAIEEDISQGLNRPAKQKSNELALQNKYANMTVENRLMLQRAEALSKYTTKQEDPPLPSFQPEITQAAKSKTRLNGSVFEELYSLQSSKNSQQVPQKEKKSPLPSKKPLLSTTFREEEILKKHQENLVHQAIQQAIEEEEQQELRNFKASEMSEYYLQKKSESIAEGRRNLDKQDLTEQHSFKPQLNQQTQKMSYERQGNANNKLYQMAQIIQQKKEERIQKEKEQSLSQYSYKPVTSQYNVKTTFEQRKQSAIDKKQTSLKSGIQQEIDPECTFSPKINKSSLRNQTQSSFNAAKTSELEARAINQHIKRLNEAKQGSPQKKTIWSQEPTVQQPFKASHVTINTSEIRPEITEEGIQFLDMFDINLNKPQQKSESESKVVQVSQNNMFTQIHKLFQNAVFQMTENDIYQSLREERNFQLALEKD